MNKTKTVLCIDNLDNFHKYKEGKYPSHLFYGAIEIEEANYQLLMKQCHGDNIIGMIKSLYIVIINCPDAIFCPFIRRSFILIFLLKKLRLINIPIIGFIHKTPTTKNKYTKKIIKYLYSSIDTVFFLSPKTKTECLELNITKKSCIPNWGGDLTFYDKNRNNELRDYFISTGKENRDFSTIIEAFSQTNSNIKIYTNTFNNDISYNYLISVTKDIPNISIQIVENKGYILLELLEKVSNSFCVVVPLIKDKIKYCVGLSSIIDAMSLGKPIIITDNPYHPIDVEKEHIGIKVPPNDTLAWKKAIEYLYNNPSIAIEMGKNARLLAEKKYNMKKCGKIIIQNLNEILLKK